MNKQAGFSPVLAALLILVVATVGFGAYRVFNKNTNKDKTSENAAQEKDKETDETVDQLPEGYTKFSDSKTGIKFTYPTAWGEAIIGVGPEEDHLVQGDEYVISFGLNPNVTAGLVSNNREHDPNQGHGGIIYAGAYTGLNYSDYKTSVSVEEHQNNSSTILFTTPIVDLIDCAGVATILIQKTGSTRYDSIAFLYYDKIVGINSPDQAVCDNFKTYVSSERVNELKAIASTVKAD